MDYGDKLCHLGARYRRVGGFCAGGGIENAMLLTPCNGALSPVLAISAFLAGCIARSKLSKLFDCGGIVRPEQFRLVCKDDTVFYRPSNGGSEELFGWHVVK